MHRHYKRKNFYARTEGRMCQMGCYGLSTGPEMGMYLIGVLPATWFLEVCESGRFCETIPQKPLKPSLIHSRVELCCFFILKTEGGAGKMAVSQVSSCIPTCIQNPLTRIKGWVQWCRAVLAWLLAVRKHHDHRHLGEERIHSYCHLGTTQH